jgi:hypothetical protein
VKLFKHFPQFFLTAASFFFANSSSASIAELCELPDKLTFTSIAHPVVKSQIQPLIKDVYKSIGIDVNFIVTASKRDLRLISNGEVMGAAIFSEDVFQGISGINKVYPALLQASNMLLCRKGLPCTEEELNNYQYDKPIAISRAMSDAFLKRYPNVDKSHLLITNEMKNVLNLLRYKRVDYGIYPISDHTKDGLKELPTFVDSEFLYSVSSYHIISSELSCIQPMVEQVLADALLAQK